jgi:DNA repair exonuclease SbcCD ATPase subunit
MSSYSNWLAEDLRKARERIVELASSVQFWQDRSERIAEDKMDLARRNAELEAENERLRKALHSISSSTAPRSRIRG